MYVIYLLAGAGRGIHRICPLEIPAPSEPGHIRCITLVGGPDPAPASR
jgi:hypothetical protein